MHQGWRNSSSSDWEQFFTFGDSEREEVVVSESGGGLELAPGGGKTAPESFSPV